MEAIHDPGQSSVSWVARILEVLQPLSLRADRLAGMELFAGLRWSDLEFVAERLHEAEVDRGTRMTVQGRPSSRLWLITQGEALVSANARPLRVAGSGDAVGLASLLHGGGSPDTTIALSTMRALAANPDEFRELVARPAIRERPAAAGPVPPGARRPAKPASENASAHATRFSRRVD